MSSHFFDEQLRKAITSLQDLLLAENLPDDFPKDDKKAYQSHFGILFIRYVEVLRMVEECHDQILQPQKRADILKLLESVIGRVIELYKVLVDLNGFEHPCLHDLVVDFKMLPTALDIPVPRIYIESRARQLLERKNIMEALAKEYELQPPSLENKKSLAAGAAASAQMTQEQAVLLIQTAERARQGRQRAMFMKVIRAQEAAEQRMMQMADDDVDPDAAATKIQKIFRAFSARKLTSAARSEEMEFLGMLMKQLKTDDANSGSKKDPLELHKQIRDRRKVIQQQYAHDLEQVVRQVREQMIQADGIKYREDWHDVVLEYILQKKVATGKLDKIPSEEEGGSYKYMLDQEPKPPAAEDEEGAEGGKGKGKGKGKGGKDDKKGKGDKGKGKGKGKGGGGGDDEEKEQAIEPSKFANDIVQYAQRIIDIWENKVLPGLENPGNPAAAAARPATAASATAAGDAAGSAAEAVPAVVSPAGGVAVSGPLSYATLKLNRSKQIRIPQLSGGEMEDLDDFRSSDRPSMDLLMEELRPSVEVELRKEVDETLRMELENLDSSDAKPAKGKKGKGKSGKKGKKGKGGKKGKKDATEGEDPNIQFARLFKLGVVHDVPSPAFLEDFIGETNLLASLYESQNILQDPSFADVRQAVAMYSILPLGLSAAMHAKVAAHVKGLLLYGPSGSGKTLLARAIATSTGAMFFNLSPSNLEGKVEGKEIGKLIGRVFRVAKLHAPSVIYIDDADTMVSAAKKGKKTGGSGLGGKMLKDLQTKVKELLPGERVLVVGETRSPGPIDPKVAATIFDRYVYCPRPDYGTRLNIWKTLIQKRGGPTFSDTDLQPLAHLSDGYTAGIIARVVSDVITEQRLKRVAQKPIAVEELSSSIAKYDPVWVQQHQELTAFNEALAQPRCRRKNPPPPEASEGGDEKKGKGKKGKKK